MEDGLTRASRFAPYCRRMVLGPDLSVGGDVLEVAGRLGIGMAVRRGGTVVNIGGRDAISRLLSACFRR